jgi:hypothetical protein
MILEYDEFCMFLLNIEIFNIMTPDFPYISENELYHLERKAFPYKHYLRLFYFHLFNVLLIEKNCVNEFFFKKIFHITYIHATYH